MYTRIGEYRRINFNMKFWTKQNESSKDAKLWIDLRIYTICWQRKHFPSNSDIQQTDLPLSSLDLSYDGSQSPGSSNLSSQSRSKRMRTSFKHHQLRTMKSYFAINQNPDAKDLKQLAQKTGLSKRVLQVNEIPEFFFVFIDYF